MFICSSPFDREMEETQRARRHPQTRFLRALYKSVDGHGSLAASSAETGRFISVSCCLLASIEPSSFSISSFFNLFPSSHMPTVEDFLKLRETLKERERQKLRRRNGTDTAASSPSPTPASVEPPSLPSVRSSDKHHSHGSFCGTSEMLVPKRVLHTSQAGYQKTGVSKRQLLKDASVKKLKLVCSVPFSKARVRFLKEARDYAFLFKSDDVEKVPAKYAGKPSLVKTQRSEGVVKEIDGGPKKAISANPGSNQAAAKPQIRVLSTPPGVKQKQESKIGRKRSFESAPKQASQIGGNRSFESKSKLDSQFGSNFGDGRLESKPNQASQTGSKNLVSKPKQASQIDGNCRSLLSNTTVEGKKHPETKIAAPRRHEMPPKKRIREFGGEVCSDFEDPDNVSTIIRKMFGYDPSKYKHLDSRDDRNMEAGFRTIEMEEKRSARLAREEDKRELALIEAEERREREARKKRKLQGTSAESSVLTS